MTLHKVFMGGLLSGIAGALLGAGFGLLVSPESPSWLVSAAGALLFSTGGWMTMRHRG